MSEIVAASGMSRRGNEHAFRQHLHRSINNELNRYRIERAKELLGTSTLNASQIAARTGFSGLMYFSRMFKQLEGIGPREFRNQHRAH